MFFSDRRRYSDDERYEETGSGYQLAGRHFLHTASQCGLFAEAEPEAENKALPEAEPEAGNKTLPAAESEAENKTLPAAGEIASQTQLSNRLEGKSVQQAKVRTLYILEDLKRLLELCRKLKCFCLSL
jgi:hypothetical protein